MRESEENHYRPPLSEREQIDQAIGQRDLLMQKFLEKEISADEFLAQIDELESNLRSYDESTKTVEILRNPEVQQKISVLPESAFGYNNLLSLAYFHMARGAGFGGNISGAIESNAQALTYAKQANGYVQEGDVYGYDWVNYLEETLAYFEKDVDRLQKCIDAMPGHKKFDNKEIMQSLLNGLNEHETPDYQRDCISMEE